jgi:hypothetical protein
MNNAKQVISVLAITIILRSLTGCSSPPCGAGSGEVKDEAACVGRTVDTFPAADEDYFADMDYGVTKNKQVVGQSLAPFVPGITPELAVSAVIKGRNNWIVWSAGNDKFWDFMATESRGNLDLLKTLSNYDKENNNGPTYNRDNRWHYLGLVNEPCFEQGNGPRADRYGLRLDHRTLGCAKDPFENEEKYPGVKIGARGANIEVGSFYGYASGVVGLRLFPNPNFDAQAESNWDAVRYYDDPGYFNNKDLVRPYRVGMSCGFCHVGPNPTNPPSDPENPSWANLNSNPGAQYFWVDRIFSYEADESSFPYQLFHSSRPGALDTSLVSSDYINNPRTMNAIYNLVPRLQNAKNFAEEKLAQGSLDNAQLNDYLPKTSPLTAFYKAPDTVYTPRVLKDGADSVGALGALNRVYVNIGLFSEEWTTHFRPLVGGKDISPFPIKVARKNSIYWQANEAQTPDLALFFVASAKPDYLKNAPGGNKYLTLNNEQLSQGKAVFAENCAGCHSSKLPEKAYRFFPNGCVNEYYLECWDNYEKWVVTDEFKTQMTAMVKQPDFLENNFLSNELRVPVSLLETNLCSPLATNGIKGNIWDNFTSESYKNLPSVGSVPVHHPMTGAISQYAMPAGGRGYTRPASLISLWSSAPYLLNNTVGDFYASGSVDDRMRSFKSGIEKMLWPEKRTGNGMFKTQNGKMLPGQIDRTSTVSYLRVPAGYLPGAFSGLQSTLQRWLPWLVGDDGVEIGPIPKGTPVGLLSNINLDSPLKVAPAVLRALKALKKIPKDASNEQAIAIFEQYDVANELISVSKCPDYVVNKGHYFGTQYLGDSPGLDDEDKYALIEFLKTM